jgi:DNA polymerase
MEGSSKIEQLRHLAARAADCQKCPHLAARRQHVVFGVGDPEAKLMFVGEGPGEEEDRQGEPFVGRAGQLLTKMITAMGLTRETVYIANIVKCRPDLPPGVPGNRKPTRAEMDTCLPYLRAQIDLIQPQVIVALGATAVEGLLGPVGAIGQMRGKFLDYRGITLLPTYHPSYLLRNNSLTEKRKVWEDLLQAMERLELPISEKQRGFFLNK